MKTLIIALLALVSNECLAANEGWSQVGPSGNSYRVKLELPPAPVARGSSPVSVQATVLSRSPEPFFIEIGRIVNGVNQADCFSLASNDSTATKELSCPMRFGTTYPAGRVQLYVAVKNPNFSPNLPMFTCTEAIAASQCTSVNPSVACQNIIPNTPDYQRCIEDAGSRAQCTEKRSDKITGCEGNYTLDIQ